MLSMGVATPGVGRVVGREEAAESSFLFSDGNMSGTLAALRALYEEHPELEGRVNLNFLTESFFDSAAPDILNNSDVLVLDMMNQQLLERYDSAHDTNLIREVVDGG